MRQMTTCTIPNVPHACHDSCRYGIPLQVQPNHHGELLQEIRSVGSHGLRHVEVRGWETVGMVGCNRRAAKQLKRKRSSLGGRG